MITMSLPAQMNPSLLKEKLPTDSCVGKESACNTGDLSSIPVLGRSPGEGKDYRFQWVLFWPGELHELYSPWGHKSQTQMRFSSTHIHTHTYIHLPKYLTWTNHHNSRVKQLWYYFLCISGEIKAIRNTIKLFIRCPQVIVIATMGIGISKSGVNTISFTWVFCDLSKLTSLSL